MLTLLLLSRTTLLTDSVMTLSADSCEKASILDLMAEDSSENAYILELMAEDYSEKASILELMVEDSLDKASILELIAEDSSIILELVMIVDSLEENDFSILEI